MQTGHLRKTPPTVSGGFNFPPTEVERRAVFSRILARRDDTVCVAGVRSPLRDAEPDGSAEDLASDAGWTTICWFSFLRFATSRDCRACLSSCQRSRASARVTSFSSDNGKDSGSPYTLLSFSSTSCFALNSFFSVRNRFRALRDSE